MFYSIKEAANKLNKTEEQVKELVKEGRLREFRDGPNLLFKVDEVEALRAETGGGTAEEITPGELEEVSGEAEISLAPELEEPAGGDDLSGQTTPAAGEGINILGEETTGEYKVSDDSMAETKAAPGRTGLPDDMLAETKAGAGEASLEEIEGDVNLDTFGSGSGLLDLSLQADDTSLGGILDEIYTPEGEEEAKAAKEAKEGSAIEVAAEAEQLMPEEEITAPQVIEARGAAVYVEAEPDAISNALGMTLWIAIAVLTYTAAVTVVAQRGAMPAILSSVQGFIWYILVGLAAATGLIVGGAFMLNRPAGPAAAAKPKEAKPKKEKKAKKDKGQAKPAAGPESRK